MSAAPLAWADVGGVDIFFGLLALAVFLFGIGLFIEFRRLALADAMISGSQLLGTFAAFPMALALGWVAYANVNEHRLLRGECRYTAAWVYENGYNKGNQESRFAFQVRGQVYRFNARMEWRGGWRPLHSRWYVRYAVPDPQVNQYIDLPVPDSTHVVPADGWAVLPLPQPPDTLAAAAASVAPTPAIEEAPVPTGPVESPVFQPVRPDSTSRSRPLVGPYAAPVPPRLRPPTSSN